MQCIQLQRSMKACRNPPKPLNLGDRKRATPMRPERVPFRKLCWASGRAAESRDIWFFGVNSQSSGTICWSGWATWLSLADPAFRWGWTSENRFWSWLRSILGCELFIYSESVRWKMQTCKCFFGCKGCRSAEEIMMTRPAEYSNEPLIRSDSGRQEAITATCCASVMRVGPHGRVPKVRDLEFQLLLKLADCDIFHHFPQVLPSFPLKHVSQNGFDLTGSQRLHHE